MGVQCLESNTPGFYSPTGLLSAGLPLACDLPSLGPLSSPVRWSNKKGHCEDPCKV